MQVWVKGKRIAIGDALRGHVTENLGTVVGKYFGNPIGGQAVFAREKHRFRCEISVHVGRDILVNSHGEAPDAYLAFAAALEHLAKRLRRQKRRLRGHHARAAGAALLRADGSATVEKDEPGGSIEAPLVIAEMAGSLLHLSVREAVLHIDLARQPVLLFRNRAHGRPNLIYRRPDGNIGWVDPDLASGLERSGRA